MRKQSCKEHDKEIFTKIQLFQMGSVMDLFTRMTFVTNSSDICAILDEVCDKLTGGHLETRAHFVGPHPITWGKAWWP